jgi:glutathione S-transferase
MIELVALHYSPWSEKARWALDHHGVEYKYRPYVPMLGELPLRIRAGKMRGKITVPILFDGKRVIGDSYEIAQYAESVGGGAPLFRGEPDPVAPWNARSEEAMAAGRGRVIARIGADLEAKRESLVSIVPSALVGVSVPVAAMGTRFLASKHGTSGAALDAGDATVAAALVALREGLAGKPYLLGDFSYADIAMAVVLQAVTPVSDAYLRLGPATRRCWTHDAFGRQFADLVEWRDGLYARHRRPHGERSRASA